jgi:hypothetical protein
MAPFCSWVLAATLAAATAGGAGLSRFPVFDNMFFKNKPDTAPYGLSASNLVYAAAIWPGGRNYGALPPRRTFEAIVAANSVNPGPVVLDIEKLPLAGEPDTIARHLHTLATLADWARATAPGKVVGYYGFGTLTNVPAPNRQYARQLARHVDAFFPPLYTYDDDRAGWERRAAAEAAEDRSYGQDKPLYFYLWPQYHDRTPRQFQWIDGGYWQFQLQTARRYGDGIAIWGSNRFQWDASSGWWAATLAFMAQTQKGR